MDFRVQGGNVIEFCDPANPQFLPVVAVRSPVTLTVAASGARAGGSGRGGDAFAHHLQRQADRPGGPAGGPNEADPPTDRRPLARATTSTCTRSRAGGLANGSSGSGRGSGAPTGSSPTSRPWRPTAASTRRREMAVAGPPKPRRRRDPGALVGGQGGRVLVRALARRRSRSGPGSPRTSGSPSRGSAGGPCPSPPSWAPSPTSSPLTPFAAASRTSIRTRRM